MKLFENYIYYKITFLIMLFFILVKFTLDHSPFNTVSHIQKQFQIRTEHIIIATSMDIQKLVFTIPLICCILFIFIIWGILFSF